MTNKTTTIEQPLYEYMLANQPSESEAQISLRQATAAHPYHDMQISPEQGHLLAWLIKAMAIKNIVELGVFTGYSALTMAQALPKDGKLIACDISQEWTDIAKPFWQQAGVSELIELQIGPAKTSLEQLIEQGQSATFDMIFIDADKRGYPDYYELSLELIRPGGLIIFDNVFLSGQVATAGNPGSTSEIMRTLNQKISQDTRVDHVIIPISDGLNILRKIL